MPPQQLQPQQDQQQQAAGIPSQPQQQQLQQVVLPSVAAQASSMQRLGGALQGTLSSSLATDFVEGLKPVMVGGALQISTHIQLAGEAEPVFIGMFPTLQAAVDAQKQSQALVSNAGLEDCTCARIYAAVRVRLMLGRACHRTAPYHTHIAYWLRVVQLLPLFSSCVCPDKQCRIA
jgi:hypothetical protein